MAMKTEEVGQIGDDFSLEPFGEIIQSHIDATLKEEGKDSYRKGTILTPKVLVWLVLTLTVRRDLSYDKALNWMVSGLRWLTDKVPLKSKLVSDGAISHARSKLGADVFRLLFAKLVTSFGPLPADFHGRISVAFDGSTGTMPDSEANRAVFGRPKARQGQAAFPQVRLMGLLALAQRRLIALNFAPYSGKGTGERALMKELLTDLISKGWLFLLDAGLYAFDLIWHITQNEGEFIVKVPSHVKFKPTQRLPDGSWLAQLTGKVIDPDAGPTPSGRQRRQSVSLTVRVIWIEIPGFRPFWLMTNLLSPTITAREIALHYHRRWDIEIAYDEIKTHQCATLRGQLPTLFRSKRPELVQQEIYALAITYNLVRSLISQAALEHQQDPCAISFLDALQHIIDAAPLMSACPTHQLNQKRSVLSALIADCLIDRPRRPRLNPRVIKVKMSKFLRKQPHHHSVIRDIVKELKILDPDFQSHSVS